MAQSGEEDWFRKIGEDGVSSFASRMTQGIFVGHHDRTGTVLCITKNGFVRGKSWTRQTLSDAWESANWEGLCGTPWQMVAPELRLTEKVTADKEGARPPLPRIVVERVPEAEPRRFYVCLRTLKLTDTREVVQDVQRWHRMEKRQSHTTMNAERESERSSREL